MRKKREHSKKKFGLKKILLITFSVLILLIAIILGGIFHLLSKTTKVVVDNSTINVDKDAAKLAKENSVTNIALFGIDAPLGKNGRSDAIMILSIDEKHKKVKLSSIMRDSRVEIPGHGLDKINHAYAFGGPSLAIGTLNTNFKLDIDKFITVNFTTLPQIIDALGGVNINITNAEIKYIPGVTHAGMQTLNGAEALAYSRIRYDGGDQMRTQRQRNVLESIFNKIIKLPVSKYPSTLDTLLPLVNTNMTSTQFLSLGKDFVDISPKKLDENRFPCDTHRKNSTLKGVSYQTFDLQTERNELHQFIFEQ